MPSIFIWKSDKPNTSNTFIKFYSGSNWVLEDNEYSSKSYIYLEQIVISESDNSVITFHTKNMPQDWVGNELLEVINVQYERIKTDAYGTLERIGDWVRFTSKNEIDFDVDVLQNEFVNIKKWITEETKSKETKSKESYTAEKSITNIDPNKVQQDFQEFLLKYNVKNIIANNSSSYNQYNNIKKIKM
jgi:hypothetical protein